MSQTNIPGHHQTIMPYLIVQNAEGFIRFMQQVFHAVETHKGMRDAHTVMHAEVKIGSSTIMLADSTEQYPPQNAGLFVYVDNADDTFAKALEAGASVVLPLADQGYGRSGGVKDPFGNTWWITSV